MAVPGSQATGGELSGSSAGSSDRRSGLVLAAIVLAPFVALLVWALTTTLWSAGDVALTEIAVRDVGGVHTPLLGAYSRYRWHHPGPLFVYGLAGPYRLLGWDGSALVAGAVLLNAVAGAGSAWILWRRGRLGGLVVGALAVAILLHSLGGDVLASPWNPVATVLPMLLFVLAVWAVVGGDAWMLPVVVAAGSFLVQTHVGTAAVVVAGLLTACITLLVSRATRRGHGRVWIVSVALGVVLWIPPIIQAARHRGGNLRALVAFWTSAHDHVTGWSRAARIVGAEFAVDAPWITGRLPHRGFLPGVDPEWMPPVVGVVFVVALVVALRRGYADAARLGWITIGFLVVAWVSVARIVDEPFVYLVRWTELVGLFAWLTVGWTVVELARERGHERVWRAVGGLAVVATLVVTVVTSVRAFDTSTGSLGEERILVRLAPRLQRVGPGLPGPVLVADLGDISSAGLGASVLSALIDAGVDARFPGALAWQLGGSHGVRRDRAGTRLLVAYGDESAPLATDPRYRVLAAIDELRPAERRELDRLHAEFTDFASQVRWTRQHPVAAHRLAQLTRRSARALVLVERG